jgi:hypothetical protein
MTIIPFGKITVTTAGTPVQLSATSRPVSAVVFCTVAGAGKMFIGVAGMVASTGAGVLSELNETVAGLPDRFTVGDPEGADT